jgi:PAS domain-containing protein
VLQTGVPVETVQNANLADGTNPCFFHINIFPINGAGNKKMLGGHAVNLSENYAAEKQLREANDRLLLLTRTTSDAIWEWDMQTGYIFRNDALMDMIGYHPKKKRD